MKKSLDEQNIVPEKIIKGDEIRVIASSCSMGIISKENITLASQKLAALGFKVSFGKHVDEMDMMKSSSINSRIKDLHDAFKDKSVKAILMVIGGSNCNQLLDYIDYDLIRNNPKILCGFSDITAMQNAIYARAGLVSYSGPHFSTFAMQLGNEYTIDYFLKMFTQNEPFSIYPSAAWSDDAWFLNQQDRAFYPNDGYWNMAEGEAEGIIIGGNLGTLQLLHGTSFMPDLRNKILFIEADSITNGSHVQEFDRDLQSLLHQSNADSIKGIVIGRFENKFSMTNDKLRYILTTKRELKSIPIVANLDFGHTMPIFTFPIGGSCRLSVSEKETTVEIIQGIPQ